MSMEPEVLFDKLASLEHPDDVAAVCRDHGIRGEATNTTACVLVKLFYQETSAAIVRVDGEVVEWSLTQVNLPWWDSAGWGERKEMSPTMVNFVHQFDNGKYPDLLIEEDYE